MLAQFESGTRDEVGVFHWLLQYRCAAGVPCATVGGGRGIPQLFIVRAHAVDGIAACAARQVEQADAREGLGAARQGRAGVAGAAQNGVAHRRRKHVGERRTAGVDRHATVWLEGVDEVALVAAQGLVLAGRGGQQDVEALGIEVAETGGHFVALDIATARFGHIGKGACFQALVVFLDDEVDHAADGVGTVDGGRAILEYFDALDCRERNRVKVDCGTFHAVGRHAAAVEQNQGAVGALAAQVGRGCTIVAALGAGGHVRVRSQVVGTVAVHVQGGDQLFGADDALFFELLPGDDLDRQCAFLGDALDATARNFDALHDLLGSGYLGHYRPCDADQGDQLRYLLYLHEVLLGDLDIRHIHWHYSISPARVRAAPCSIQ